MKVAITGATGFLGSWVVKAALEQGHRVVALGRNEEKGSRLKDMGATFHRVDLADGPALSKALEGVETVIHSAALSSPWGTSQAFHEANVAGSVHLAEEVRRQGIARLVFVSSASVYASKEDKFGWKETDSLPPPLNAYAASKQEAERALATMSLGDRLVVLRPRAIFGHGDTALWPRLKRLADRNAGVLPLFRGGCCPMDMLYVEDAADACLAALKGPAGTYNLPQGEPRPVKDVLETVFAHRQLPIQWRRLPVKPVLGLAAISEAWHAWCQKPGEPLVTRYAIHALAHAQTLDTTAAQQRLGWKPRWTLDAALAKTFLAPASLLERGLFE